MVCGAREWLEGNDDRCLEWDTPAVLVAKDTGEITELVVIEHLDRLGRMTPVGS